MLWRPVRALPRLVLGFGGRTRGNHFERLGIGESASRAEVRAAFLSLAKRLHPDVSAKKDLAEAQRDFVALKAAYDVLSDSDRRARYTATFRRGGQSQPQSYDDDGQDTYSHTHARAHSQHHTQQQQRRQRGAKTDLVSYTVGTWAQLEMELEAALHHAQHGPAFNPETDGEWPPAFEIEERGAVHDGEWGGRVCVGQVVCGSRVLGGVWWDGGGRLEGARAVGEEGKGGEEGTAAAGTSTSTNISSSRETVLDLCDPEGRPLARLVRHSPLAQPTAQQTAQDTAHTPHSHSHSHARDGGSSTGSGSGSDSSSSSGGSEGGGWVEFLKLQPSDPGGLPGQRWEAIARLVLGSSGRGVGVGVGVGSGSGSSGRSGGSWGSESAGGRRGVLLDPRLPPPLQETHRLIRQAAPGVQTLLLYSKHGYLEFKGTRAWLPPSDLWLLPPRDPAFASGGWYWEHNRFGLLSRRRVGARPGAGAGGMGMGMGVGGSPSWVAIVSELLTRIWQGPAGRAAAAAASAASAASAATSAATDTATDTHTQQQQQQQQLVAAAAASLAAPALLDAVVPILLSALCTLDRLQAERNRNADR